MRPEKTQRYLLYLQQRPGGIYSGKAADDYHALNPILQRIHGRFPVILQYSKKSVNLEVRMLHLNLQCYLYVHRTLHKNVAHVSPEPYGAMKSHKGRWLMAKFAMRGRCTGVLE